MEQQAAVRHIFRVAAGLDSMILGEPQVLGQIKSAFRNSCEAGAMDFLLQRLFQRAFSVAKLTRTQTNIGRQPVSVASAATVLCEHIFGELEDAKILLIGAGETGALMLRHLRQKNASDFVIINRTFNNAKRLADESGGTAVDISELNKQLAEADIIISAATLSADSSVLIEKADIDRYAAERRGRMQLFIDLGVPRNIDDTITQLPDVFLYNVDDLHSVVQDNTAKRLEAAVEAERLIDHEAAQFIKWIDTRRVHVSIRDARKRVSQFEKVEIDKSIKRLRKAGFSSEHCEQLREVLGDYSEALVAKVLHQPFKKLHEVGPHDEEHLESFSEYFLDDVDKDS
ncbi:UNVERIFIED_CONTAM: hypothetical protein GTU68_011968 [Idotea baltica]|nr:hypothetical protein [Idotea baltica]